MVRKLTVVVTALAVALTLVSPAAAQYGGTTVTPSEDGTFNLSADPGSAVILDLTAPAAEDGAQEEGPAPAPVTEIALDFAGAAEGAVAVANFGAEVPEDVAPPPAEQITAFYRFDLGAIEPTAIAGITFTVQFPFGRVPVIWVQNAAGEWYTVPLVPLATDGKHIFYQVALSEVPTYFAVAELSSLPTDAATEQS